MVAKKRKVAQKATPPEATVDDQPLDYPQLEVDLEKVKDELIAKGLKQKFITEKEIAAALPVDDMAPQDLDALYTSFLERGIPVLDTEGEAGEEAVEELAAVDEGEILSWGDADVVSDPVRMYLREIGRVPLLGPGDEIELARAIRQGVIARRRLGDLLPGV